MIESIKKVPIPLLVFIFIGLVLRVVWTSDMEYHFDAHWMFNKAHEVVKSGKLPWLGMENGARFLNPGLSVWFFAAIALFTETAIEMTMVVQWLNAFALIGFFVFALLKVPEEEKLTWYFAIALAACSPLSILWSRKIWAQDVLPIICLVIFLGHYYRHKHWGAFLWGFVGALIGQVHMSGFFYSFGLFIFTLLYERKNGWQSKWITWFIASTLGALFMLPWVIYYIETNPKSRSEFKYIFQLKFYVYSFLQAFGLHMKYILKDSFVPFLEGPKVFGRSTFIMAFVYGVQGCAGLYFLKELGPYFKKLWQQIRRKEFFSNLNLTDFYLLSMFLGMGISLTLARQKIHAHYLIILFPFIYLAVARVMKFHKKMLYLIIFCNLLISLTFFLRIHFEGGFPDSHYGWSYKEKLKRGIKIDK